ncbi:MULTISPECIES: lipase family protein [Myroides]|uniref:lipase family protein n=1 Tax=Myroides TaxID=76831 RepID=UPI0013258601|nr:MULTISPECIES: lipase family protein [Myroides]MVX34518.1 lipase family protein [Myroides sp. LoEW2-1]UVD79501.1 lipase family protein [Myroides albus]
MKKLSALIISLLSLSHFCNAQLLSPKYDKQEILNSIELATDLHKAYPKDSLNDLTNYERIYSSNDIGLTNKWSLYKNEKGIHEIAIRGSVNKGLSWMANYYAAMIPSTDSIKLDANTTVYYKLSEDSRAGVHAGWTIASLYLMQDIKPKLDSLLSHGHRDIIISGHSQGAAIAILLTANLYQQQKDNKLPKDLRIKTYAIAAPKPGNLYFSYQYEALTRQWSYTVINTLDWVPEVPPTTQMLSDFNAISPFSDKETTKMFKGISWPKRWFAQGIFKGLKNPTKKSVKKYNKYLGGFIFKQIHKDLPELQEPKYLQNANYHRVSNPIILNGIQDKEYMKTFNEVESIMTHHNPPAYKYLTNKQL